MKTISILRRFFILISFCCVFGAVQAQYAPIPDVNFGYWLSSHGYSSCMTFSGTWRLDTTCTAVLNDTALNCSGANITDLTGVRYFASLQSLYCNNNQLTTLPDLPPSLTTLQCSFNQIVSAPDQILPASLSYFDCQGNNLDSLPQIPSNIWYINCSGNKLTALPVLPGMLMELHCYSNKIATLPSLPSGLWVLRCDDQRVPDSSSTGYHGLYSLPALPAGLSSLSCGYNNITRLPALSSNLGTLICPGNPIDSLPSLPTWLTWLDISYTLFRSIPELPPHLLELYANNDRLTQLPSLPASLNGLFVRNNDLSELPVLPRRINALDVANNPRLSCLPFIYQQQLLSFYIAQTNIHCVPSRFTVQPHQFGYDIMPDTIPLCDAASGCDFYYNIVGNVHNDDAATCQADSLTPGAPVSNIKVRLKQGGTVMQQMYSSRLGGYSFKTPAYGAYTIDIDTTALPLSIACPQAGARTVTISAADSVKKDESFGVQCAGVDMGVNTILGSRFRPGFQAVVAVSAGDLTLQRYGTGCGGGAVTITTTLGDGLHYTGPAAGALTPAVSGQTLTYTITEADSLRSSSLNITVETDSTAVAGDQVCITTTITTTQPDVVPADNTLTQCFEVRNSHDPNYKEVYPDTMTRDASWLTYTVHFQNTGSDTAYLVVLKDTLSQYVDAASFQYLASSHHAVIQLEGGAMTFTFPHINLVDSATNPPLSEGWIQYRVRANTGLPNGTAINNTAYIYFDLNPAVVTNTATTTVQMATCVDGDIYDSTTICQGDTFVYGGMTMTTTGIYYNLMQNATGCDTTYHIWLTVLPAAHTTLYDTICAGSSYAFGGHQLTAAGTYSDTLASAGGCDSIISLALTVRPTSYLLIADTICSGEMYIYLHDTLTTSDSAIYIFQNAYGCDSFVQLILTVRPAPQVTFSWDTLVSQNYITYVNSHFDSVAFWCELFFPRYMIPMAGGIPAGGHYSGLDVSNDTLNGRSAFIDLYNINRGFDSIIYTYTDAYGCSASVLDTISINMCGGVNDIPYKNAIHIYPNPNTGTFTLVTERSYGLSYRVYDVLGEEVIQGSITADTQPIRLPDVAEGVYTISVDGSRPLRFVVVR